MLRHVRTYLESTITQYRLNNGMLLRVHFHNDMTKDVDVLKVVTEFVSINVER